MNPAPCPPTTNELKNWKYFFNDGNVLKEYGDELNKKILAMETLLEKQPSTISLKTGDSDPSLVYTVRNIVELNKLTNTKPDPSFFQKVVDNAKKCIYSIKSYKTKAQLETPCDSACSCSSESRTNTTDKEIFQNQINYCSTQYLKNPTNVLKIPTAKLFRQQESTSDSCDYCLPLTASCVPVKFSENVTHHEYTTLPVSHVTKTCPVQQKCIDATTIKNVSNQTPPKSCPPCSPCPQCSPPKKPDGDTVSDDKLELMKTLTDLASKEKQMRCQLEVLQAREQTYKEVLKNFENRLTSPTTPSSIPQTNVQEELNKISNNLTLENKLLKDELLDMKIELKHCLERIEGPMQRKLDTEKCKCQQLKQELNQTSQNMVVNQDTYMREMNSLKMQLCMACSNMAEMNTMNNRLKNELAGLNSMCSKLEDDLISQKLKEADTLRMLTKRRSFPDEQEEPVKIQSCPDTKKVSSEPFKCDENLHTIARKLSDTLRQSAPCSECAKLPSELAGAAKCIKDLTDMVVNRKAPIEKTNASNQMNELKDGSSQSKPTSDEGHQCAPGENVAVGYSNTQTLYRVEPVSGTSFKTANEKPYISNICVEDETSKFTSSSKIICKAPCSTAEIDCNIHTSTSSKALAEGGSVNETGRQTSDIPFDSPLKPKDEINPQPLVKYVPKYQKVKPIEYSGSSDKDKPSEKSTKSEGNSSDKYVEEPIIHSKIGTISTQRSKKSSKTEPIICNNETFPFNVQTELQPIDKIPDGLQVLTTITASGTLEVITESPNGFIETTLTLTDDGNIEVLTELTEFRDSDTEATSKIMDNDKAWSSKDECSKSVCDKFRMEQHQPDTTKTSSLQKMSCKGPCAKRVAAGMKPTHKEEDLDGVKKPEPIDGKESMIPEASPPAEPLKSPPATESTERRLSEPIEPIDNMLQDILLDQLPLSESVRMSEPKETLPEDIPPAEAGGVPISKPEDMPPAKRESIPLSEPEEIPSTEPDSVPLPLAKPDEMSRTESGSVPLLEKEKPKPESVPDLEKEKTERGSVPLSEPEEMPPGESGTVSLSEKEKLSLTESGAIPLSEKEKAEPESVSPSEKEKLSLTESGRVPLSEKEKAESPSEKEKLSLTESGRVPLSEKEKAELESVSPSEKEIVKSGSLSPSEKEKAESGSIPLSKKEKLSLTESETVPLSEKEKAESESVSPSEPEEMPLAESGSVPLLEPEEVEKEIPSTEGEEFFAAEEGEEEEEGEIGPLGGARLSHTLEPKGTLKKKQPRESQIRDSKCQTLPSEKKSCQCCECRSVGVSTSHDKDTETIELTDKMIPEGPQLLDAQSGGLSTENVIRTTTSEISGPDTKKFRKSHEELPKSAQCPELEEQECQAVCALGVKQSEAEQFPDVRGEEIQVVDTKGDDDEEKLPEKETQFTCSALIDKECQGPCSHYSDTKEKDMPSEPDKTQSTYPGSDKSLGEKVKSDDKISDKETQPSCPAMVEKGCQGPCSYDSDKSLGKKVIDEKETQYSCPALVEKECQGPCSYYSDKSFKENKSEREVIKEPIEIDEILEKETQSTCPALAEKECQGPCSDQKEKDQDTQYSCPALVEKECQGPCSYYSDKSFKENESEREVIKEPIEIDEILEKETQSVCPALAEKECQGPCSHYSDKSFEENKSEIAKIDEILEKQTQSTCPAVMEKECQGPCSYYSDKSFKENESEIAKIDEISEKQTQSTCPAVMEKECQGPCSYFSDKSLDDKERVKVDEILEKETQSACPALLEKECQGPCSFFDQNESEILEKDTQFICPGLEDKECQSPCSYYDSIKLSSNIECPGSKGIECKEPCAEDYEQEDVFDLAVEDIDEFIEGAEIGKKDAQLECPTFVGNECNFPCTFGYKESEQDNEEEINIVCPAADSKVCQQPCSEYNVKDKEHDDDSFISAQDIPVDTDQVKGSKSSVIQAKSSQVTKRSSSAPSSKISPTKIPRKKRPSKLDKVLPCDCIGICPCEICDSTVMKKRQSIGKQICCCTGLSKRRSGCTCSSCISTASSLQRSIEGETSSKHKKEIPSDCSCDVCNCRDSLELCPCNINEPKEKNIPEDCDCSICNCNNESIEVLTCPQNSNCGACNLQITECNLMNQICPNNKKLLDSILKRKKLFLTNHSSNCDCVSCRCIPKSIEEIAQMKEFPIINETKQVYQVTSVKCNCKKSSKIPIPANGSSRLRAPTDCDCPVCKCAPCPDASKGSKDPKACDCADCKCAPCPDASKGDRKGTKGPASCDCTDCKCSPCKDPAKAGRAAGGSTLGIKCCCKVCDCDKCPAGGKKPETRTTPEKSIKSSKGSVKSAAGSLKHPKDCTCKQCRCPLLDSNKMKEGTVKAVAQSKMGTKPETSKHPQDCTCKLCRCPLSKDDAKSIKKPDTKHADDCDCKQCRCPKKTGGEPATSDSPVKRTCSCEDCQCDECKFLAMNSLVCDCGTCDCDKCFDKKKRSAKEASRQALIVPCDCGDCDCEKCADPKIERKLVPCDCPDCVCDNCPDPSKISEMVPCDCGDCDCEECADPKKTQQHQDGTGKCDCTPNCLCNDCADESRAQKTHSPDCTCDKCVCDRKKETGKALCVCESCICSECIMKKREVGHPDGCKCEKCLCSPCFAKTKEAGPKTKEAGHPDGCKCDKCVCSPCFSKTGQVGHPDGCKCDKCVCSPCFTKTGEVGHPDGCKCQKCVCSPCFTKTVIHSSGCTCKQCKCSPCHSKSTKGAQTSDNKVSKATDCPCSDCSCTDCFKLKSQSGHEDACTCSKCVCANCKRMKSEKKDKQTHSQDCQCVECVCTKTVETHAQNCNCCECNKVTDKSSQSHGPGCRCSICKCDPCSDPTKSKAVGTNPSVGKLEQESKYCSCIECVCDLCSKSPTTPQGGNKCTCPVCICKPCFDESISTLKGIYPEGCTCIKCDCADLGTLDLPKGTTLCLCKSCTCELCTKTKAKGNEDKKRQDGGPSLDQLCLCSNCACSICTKSKPVVFDPLTSKKGEGDKSQQTKTGGCICGNNCPCGKCAQMNTATAQTEALCHCPECKCVECTKKGKKSPETKSTITGCQCDKCICVECPRKGEGDKDANKNAFLESLCNCDKCLCEICTRKKSNVDTTTSNIGTCFCMEDCHCDPCTKNRGGTKICQCPICKCSPCASEKTKPNKLKGLDDVALQTQIDRRNKENCQCKKEIAEIMKALNKIKCSCNEAELKAFNSSKQAFQTSTFNVTMSGLKIALGNLQQKCKAKDKMIKYMTDELHSRGKNICGREIDNLTSIQIPDYDKAQDLGDDFRYTKLKPKDIITKLSLHNKSHRHRKKSVNSKKDLVECVQSQETVTVDLSGFEITDIRRITEDSLIIKWEPPKSCFVIGYDIFVNGINKTKVLSGGRTNAMLHNLDLSCTIQITIYAVTKHGRCEPPAIAIYEI